MKTTKKNPKQKIAKDLKQLMTYLKSDYLAFLKWHSNHEDDYLDFHEWIEECIVKTVVYGWAVQYDNYYDLEYYKI